MYHTNWYEISLGVRRLKCHLRKPLAYLKTSVKKISALTEERALSEFSKKKTATDNQRRCRNFS